jgi:CRISPR-associated protein Csx17
VGHAELGSFIAESRAQVGRRSPSRGLESRPVRSTTEFAEAASSLGVARGVNEFNRFALLKRRGTSYVALPAGRFSVFERSEADLIRGLDALLGEVDRFLRSFGEVGPPKSLSSIRRGIDRAMFEALARPSPSAMQTTLSHLGQLERSLALRDRTKKPTLRSPLGGLSPRWLLAADDGCLEIRLAAALASIQACGKVGPLRANLTGIDPGKSWTWARGRGQVAWAGASVSRRLVGVLRQRTMDAARLGCRKHPLFGLIDLAPADVSAFIAGEVDDERVEELLFALSLVDWRLDSDANVRDEIRRRWRTPVRPAPVPSQFALLKLAFWPGMLPTKDGVEHSVTPEPSAVPLLLAGRIDEACRVARRRLFASGLSPVNVPWPRATGIDSIRLAAALLVPTRSLSTLTRLVLAAPAAP